MNLHYALSKAQSQSPDFVKQFAANNVDKANLYEQISDNYRKCWGQEEQDWYTHRYKQYQDMLSHVYGEAQMLEFVMQTVSPLLVDYGGASVWESSLSVHRIYGVPIISGTSLKGVCAYVCHTFLGEQNSRFSMDGDFYTALFGNQKQAGYIEFHDAWIIPESVSDALVQEIITPHHQAYNSQPPNHVKLVAPRDDDDPVPHPFLAVVGQFRFLLSCSSWQIAREQARQWLEIAEEIMVFALGEHGIGSKTNAGYGRMIK